MPSRPQTHYARGHARRRQLITATVELIAEKGIEGITHRSVAGRADMPLSTTSYFFGSMDELIGAAITEIADTIVARLDALTDELSKGELSLAEFADAVIGVATSAHRREVIVQFEAYLASDRRPELRDAVHKIMTGFEEATAKALSTAGVDDAPTLARQIVAVVDGFALHKIAWPRPDSDEALVSLLRRLLDSHLS